MPLNKRRAIPYLMDVRSYTAAEALAASRLHGRQGCGSWRNFEIAHAAIGGGGVTTYLSDAFTGTGSLDAHTMDVGSGWTEHTGDWSISGGKALSDGTGGSVATADAGQANGTLSCDVTVDLTSGASNGVTFRFTDTSNYWICTVDSSGALSLFNVASLVDSAASGMVDGNTYAFVATLNGTSISVTANGVTLNATSAAHLTATRMGLRAGASATARFDNFLMTS